MVDTEAKDTLGVFGDMDLVFGVVNDDSGACVRAALMCRVLG
jgi:hypothetical protein